MSQNKTDEIKKEDSKAGKIFAITFRRAEARMDFSMHVRLLSMQ